MVLQIESIGCCARVSPLYFVSFSFQDQGKLMKVLKPKNTEVNSSVRKAMTMGKRHGRRTQRRHLKPLFIDFRYSNNKWQIEHNIM